MQRSRTVSDLARQACSSALSTGTRRSAAIHLKTASVPHTGLPSARPFATRLARFASAAAALRKAPEVPPAAIPSTGTVHDTPFLGMCDKEVSVGWDTRTWSRYHNIWLRDHCRCPQCFHPITKQRLVNTFDIPPNVKPARVEAKVEGLEVTWSDSQPHTSLYPWSWLKHNSYNPPMTTHEHATEKILWGSKIQQSPPTVHYDEVMAPDDRGLHSWLSKIDQFGFCFVTGVPETPEATEAVSSRIGFIRETMYGKLWEFTSDLSKGDTAYTTMALKAHTDNTYFTDPCGIQLFHLLSHTGGTGGATLLVDGFYVASILKELHSDVYDMLAQVRVPAHAAGEPGELYRPSPLSGYPVLGRDMNGALIQVRWNNDDRSVMRNLDATQVEAWYEAIRLWQKLLTSADSEYWVQLTPGTVVAIDNHRVLHGRSAFDGARRMCGAYIGGDEFRSRLAVLRERFAPGAVARATAPLGVVDGRRLWDPAL